MKRKTYYFLKLQDEFFDRVDIKKIRSLPGGDSLIVIYLKLLQKLMNNQGQWVYDHILPMREDELAFWLEEDQHLVKLLIVSLKNMGLAIEITPEVLYFPESEEMTEKITDEALRKREYRKRKAEEKKALFNNVKQLDNVPACPTEGEREVEEDKNREKEREVFNNIKQKDNVPTLSQTSYSDNNTPTPVCLYGALNNIVLTDEEYAEICRTWKKPDELIDKVSCIIPNMKKRPQNIYAYIHKVGISDGFEKSDAIKRIKQEKKEQQRKQEEEQQRQQETEEWYQEKMKEYGVCSREEVDTIARQKLEEWKKNFLGKN